MLILEDTRQQKKKHEVKHQYFRSVGVHWNRTALYCGDYTLPVKQNVCIDTKKDVAELIGDIQVKQMPKREVKAAVYGIFANEHIPYDFADDLFHAICDDDTDRFAEKDINEVCYKFRLPEDIISQFQALYVKKHGFFHRGLKRAQNNGIQLYILVENEDSITCIDDLSNWQNPRLDRYVKIKSMHSLGKWKNIPLPKAEPMSGTKLAKACMTMQEKYKCKFLFCKPEESGAKILELLGISQVNN